MSEWLIAVIVVVVLCIVAVRLSRPKKFIYTYRAKTHIMSGAEEKFFKVLCEIFEHKCYVIPQVHLSALFEHKIKGQNWRGAFSHINGKSVDFVLCRKNDLSPLCAVELDDRTHDSTKRKERDSEVERIFEEANLPLVRFRNPGAMTKQEIVDRFAEVVAKSL